MSCFFTKGNALAALALIACTRLSLGSDLPREQIEWQSRIFRVEPTLGAAFFRIGARAYIVPELEARKLELPESSSVYYDPGSNCLYVRSSPPIVQMITNLTKAPETPNLRFTATAFVYPADEPVTGKKENIVGSMTIMGRTGQRAEIVINKLPEVTDLKSLVVQVEPVLEQISYSPGTDRSYTDNADVNIIIQGQSLNAADDSRQNLLGVSDVRLRSGRAADLFSSVISSKWKLVVRIQFDFADPEPTDTDER